MSLVRLVLLATALASTGCTAVDSPLPPVSMPPPQQPDPQQGLEIFLDKERVLTSITPPISRKEFESLYLTWPEPMREQARNDMEYRWRAAFDRYGFWPDPGDEDFDFADLDWEKPPFGFKLDGQPGDPDRQWNLSCLACHGGPVPDFENGEVSQRIVFGAPNLHLDMQTYLRDRLALKDTRALRQEAGIPWYFYFKKGPQNWAYFRFFNTYEAHYGQATFSRGTITPWGAVAALLEFQGRDLEVQLWEYLPVLFKALGWTQMGWYGTENADLDVPAWWATPYKDHIYADGFAPKNPWITHIGTVEEGRQPYIDLQTSGEAADMVAAFSLATPGPWPDAELPADKKIDQSKAQQGKGLYDGHCRGCHGGWQVDPGTGNEFFVYTNARQVDINTIRADTARLERGMTASLRQAIRQSAVGVNAQNGAEPVYEHIDDYPIGYEPPPLIHIWASRPYLHNGSVPTLEDLMKPVEKRPKIWKAVRIERDGLTVYDYDFEKVGLAYTEHSANELDGLDPNEKRLYFDTNEQGKANWGTRISTTSCSERGARPRAT